jgi:hypothetical protein
MRISLSFDFTPDLHYVVTSPIPSLLDIGGICVKCAAMLVVIVRFNIALLLDDPLCASQ